MAKSNDETEFGEYEWTKEKQFWDFIYDLVFWVIVILALSIF